MKAASGFAAFAVGAEPFGESIVILDGILSLSY